MKKDTNQEMSTLKQKIKLADEMNKSQLFIYHSSLKSDVIKRDLSVTHQVFSNSRVSLQDFDLEKFSLAGKHNLENLSVAIEVGLKFGASNKGIQKTIDTFKSLSFRLENLGIKNNKTYFNDSKSTNIQSTETALNSFEKKDVTLIIGGQVRDADQVNYTAWQKLIDDVGELIVFGEAANFFADKINHSSIKTVSSLKKIKNNFSKEIILFSPGFPSFDEFSNYQERESFLILFLNLYRPGTIKPKIKAITLVPPIGATLAHVPKTLSDG